MAVYLRQKKLSGGRKSFYLDIWQGEKRYYEFLKLYTVKSTNPIDKDQNEKIRELAKNIRAKRELDLQANDHGLIPQFRKNTDFLAYFEKFHENYKNKDVRLVKGALSYFRLFLAEEKIKMLSAKNLSEQICKDFKYFLESKLNGETPYNYFKKFKGVVRQAYKDKLIPENYSDGIIIVKSNSLKKDILNFEEIQTLAKKPCGNDQVKRAFLFSLNTGLRFCDVKEITWSNISGDSLKFTQAKTKGKSKTAEFSISLNKSALAMIGAPGNPDEKIFNLPSQTACLKDLKTWVKNAEIKKHITWHCARHSFAVNLLDKDGGNADVKTVAGALGHSGLDMVNVYLRVLDEKKKQAVNRLPEIEL
ncbi:MAG: site-specific integrase [Alphaproteobacteria bacterium]|nr:site-specific integrase [Alphaproteobacteria bacterium]